MGTFLLCSINVFILHTGQPATSKPALSNYLMLASVRKRLLILHSDPTSSSIWVNTAFPLNSYKQLDFFPLLNQSGKGLLKIFMGFLFFSFRLPFFFFFQIFFFCCCCFLQLLAALSVHHCGFQEQSSICNKGHTGAEN